MIDGSYNDGGGGDKRYHSSFESSGKSNNDDTNEDEEIPFSYYDAAAAALNTGPRPIPTSTTPSAPYREGEQVLYTNKSDGSTCLVVIQKVHYDDLLQPYYTIDIDGREKQTDNAHLSLPTKTEMSNDHSINNTTDADTNDKQVDDNDMEELIVFNDDQPPSSPTNQRSSPPHHHKANQEYYDILQMAENRLRQSDSSAVGVLEEEERHKSDECVLEMESNRYYNSDSSGELAVRKKKKKKKKSKHKHHNGGRSHTSSSKISSTDGDDEEEEERVESGRRSAVFQSLFPASKLVAHSNKKSFETSINPNDLAAIGYNSKNKNEEEFDPNEDLPTAPGSRSMWNPAALVTAAQSKSSDSKIDKNGFYNIVKDRADSIRQTLVNGRQEDMPTNYNLHNIGKSESNKRSKKKQLKKKKKYASLQRMDSVDWGDDSGIFTMFKDDSGTDRKAERKKPYRDNNNIDEEDDGVEMIREDDCSYSGLNEANANYLVNEKLVQKLMWQRDRRRLTILLVVVIVFLSICTIIFFVDHGKKNSADPPPASSTLTTANDGIERNEPPPRPNPPPPVEPDVFEDADTHTMDLNDLQYIVNSISPDPSVFESPHTPQSKALEWSKNDMKIYNVNVKARVAQRYILATLYYATNGTGWKANTNWGDGHECEWHGVGCEIGENNMTSVTYLDLNSNHLVGSIPQEIGYIGRLEQIHLWGNSLSLGIPSTLSQLSSLHTLYLDKNYLSGEMGDTFNQLKNLKHLDISGNRLRGHISHGLGSLTNLVDLRLSNNLLTGTFPVSLISLSNLQTLLLDSNSMSGSLPSPLGEMRSLVTIRIHENDFKGNIPSFKDAKYLEEGHFDGNYFSGQIPSFGSTRLRELYLGQNALTGSIPDSIGYLDSLEIFSASSNELTSTIPAAISKINHLNILDLSHNKLSGEIPSELSGLAMLHELRLDHNRLRGFPQYLGLLKNLEVVHLNNNLLDGKLNLDYWDLEDLSEFAIENNDLSGVVSESMCDLLLDVLTSDCWGSPPRVDCPCCTECF